MHVRHLLTQFIELVYHKYDKGKRAMNRKDING